jgi:hypothetical protein
MPLSYYKLVAESLKKELQLNVKIEFKKVDRGYSLAKGKIVIPLWCVRRNHYYALYYICHELTHQIAYKKYNHFRHDENFKTEEKILLDKFNLSPIYSRCYPKELRKAGILVYKEEV